MNRWATRGLLIVIFLLGGAVAACAATHYVNPGESIQAAIDAASPGDTINVAAGTYNEYLHITTDNLTIEGAGIDQSIIDLDGLTPYWHYGTNKSYASRAGVLMSGYGSADEIVEGVTFKGFTVMNAGLNPPGGGSYPEYYDGNGDGRDDVRGIGVHNGKDILIQDCKAVYNGYDGINIGKARNTSLTHSEGVTIDGCIASENPHIGIVVGSYKGIVIITSNTCSNNGMPHPSDPSREYVGTGILVGGRSKTYPASGIISGNTVSDNGFIGINLKKYIDGMTIEDNLVTGHNSDEDGAGIFFYHWGHPEYCKNVTVENNTVTGNIRGIVAYYASNSVIEGNTITTDSGVFDSGQAGIKLDYAEGITVQNNFLGTTGVLEGNGIRLSGGSHDNLITGNTIEGADFLAIYLSSPGDDNTITGNTIDGAVLAAIGIRQVGTGNTITGNTVTDTPWLWYTNYSIQTVLDGFAGDDDTIYVAGGAYAETVTLGTPSNLTIHGDPADRPVIEDGVKFVNTAAINGITFENLVIQPAPPAGGRAYIFKNSNSGAINDFVLKNCELDGEGADNTHGIAGNLFGGSFTVEDCLFKDIYGFAVLDIDSSSDYSPHGGNGLPFTTVTFANNTIEDCDGSVALRGHTPSRTGVVNAYGNTWTNIGGHVPATDDHWAALEVNHAEVANVYGNTIHGVPLGIWGEGQAFQFWDIPDLRCGLNVITDNAQGIWIFGGSAGGAYGHWTVPGGIVTLNKIVGNVEYGIGVDPAAISGTLDATCNWWGSVDGPDADHDFDGTVDYAGGGDAAMGAVIYSPWLGSDPDGDPTTPGVQLTQPLYIIVADVGPVPQAKTIPGYVTQSVAGYLNRAIGTANAIAGTDTIEVRHGTYNASEPITDGVNMVSEVGSASHTTLNGDMSINGDGVLIGLPLQGFRINGDVTIGAGADAATSRINWSDLYGYVTNNGTGTFDAQYNFWGTKEFAVVDERTTGLIDFEPFLPKNADDSYNDVVILLDAGAAASLDLAIQQLWTMDQLGQNVNAFLQYLSVAGVGASGGTTPGSEIILGGAAGAGGGVETTLSGTFTAGDLIEDGFTITDPLTGEPITDAAVTLSLLGPDGSNALAFWGAATYDEATGLYVFSIDTSGMTPGTYELIIQTDDGQSKTLEIVIEES